MTTNRGPLGRLLLLSVASALAASVAAACCSPRDALPPAQRAPDKAAKPPSTCQSDQDCEIAWLNLDCCGSMRAVGVRKGDAAEFERATNRPAQASCECLAAPTRLDFGPTAPMGTDVRVRCIEQACTTLVDPTTAAPAAESALAPEAAPATAPEPAPAVKAEPAAQPTSPPTASAATAPPIPCKRTADCWVSDEYPPRPIARPKHIHHAFRGCVDGEVPPRCWQGVCALGMRFGC